jgi:alkylation response protein AidB-like acyl-CoA dehydrogenase
VAAQGVRQEVRALLATPAVTQELAALREAGPDADTLPVLRHLGERRLLAPDWPAACGGRGATREDGLAVADELAAAGVPDTQFVNTIQIVGAFLLRAGSSAQREALLPRLAGGGTGAGVLFSEVAAGSDLAALQTSAHRTAGGWVLSGRKRYSLKTRFADLGLCAARTAGVPGEYQGITLFLVSLRAAGVTVRLLPSMQDEQFHEVELDDVEIAEAEVVGPVGGAWPLIGDLLAIERLGFDYVHRASRWLHAATSSAVAAAAGDDTLVRLARLQGRVEASRLLAEEAFRQLGEDRLEPATAAMAKWHASESAREVAWLAVELAGLDGCAGPAEAAYREAPGLTLSSGTSEVLLRLIADLVFPR